MLESLAVYAGAGARARLRADGWQPTLFDTLIGASGGPKMLGIAGLDKFLFGDYLQRSAHRMHLVGSSIGSWRHAALAAPDPARALADLQHYYSRQEYHADGRPTVEIVGEVCAGIIDATLDADSYQSICRHTRFQTHIVTARGRGLNSHSRPLPRALGMGLALLSNTVQRRFLQAWFQRVVFSSHGAGPPGFPFTDFNTVRVPLLPENARQALLASGSIPFVMPGERDIPGAPPGHYWDGGIIDYHFDFTNFRSDGLVLYPHFCHDITPGWFDRFLPWRRAGGAALEQLVLLCPSRRFLARLPHGKIPDRRDVAGMPNAERHSYWQQVRASSDVLGEEFAALVDGPEPLAGVRAFG